MIFPDDPNLGYSHKIAMADMLLDNLRGGPYRRCNFASHPCRVSRPLPRALRA